MNYEPLKMILEKINNPKDLKKLPIKSLLPLAEEIRQFLLESLILAIFALIISLVLCYLLLPAFNNISGKEIDFLYLSSPEILFSILGIILLTGLLGGSYPAFFLSSLRPDFILKEADRDFQLTPHLKALSEELLAYGYNIEIVDRSNAYIAVRKAFIKDDSIGKVLQLKHSGKTGPLRKTHIKFEVDTNPPLGSNFEMKYVDFPFVSYTFIIPSNP